LILKGKEELPNLRHKLLLMLKLEELLQLLKAGAHLTRVNRKLWLMKKEVSLTRNQVVPVKHPRKHRSDSDLKKKTVKNQPTTYLTVVVQHLHNQEAKLVKVKRRLMENSSEKVQFQLQFRRLIENHSQDLVFLIMEPLNLLPGLKKKSKKLETKVNLYSEILNCLENPTSKLTQQPWYRRVQTISSSLNFFSR
jgi:hypothetical protein